MQLERYMRVRVGGRVGEWVGVYKSEAGEVHFHPTALV